MSLLTQDKVMQIFCIADDFCKELEQSAFKSPFLIDDGRKHRNRSCMMRDSEVITILVCFHFGSFCNFKHYDLHYVGEHLKQDFPHQFSYSRFIQMEHRVIIPLVMFIKLVCCCNKTIADKAQDNGCSSVTEEQPLSVRKPVRHHKDYVFRTSSYIILYHEAEP